MPLRVNCPTCAAFFAVPDSGLGTAVACPNCGAVLALTVTSPTPPDRDCPFCGEPVRLTAKKCKHCRETIDVTLRAAEEALRAADRPSAQHVFMNAGGPSSSSSSAVASSDGKESGGCMAFFGWLCVVAILLFCCGCPIYYSNTPKNVSTPATFGLELKTLATSRSADVTPPTTNRPR